MQFPRVLCVFILTGPLSRVRSAADSGLNRLHNEWIPFEREHHYTLLTPKGESTWSEYSEGNSAGTLLSYLEHPKTYAFVSRLSFYSPSESYAEWTQNVENSIDHQLKKKKEKKEKSLRR